MTEEMNAITLCRQFAVTYSYTRGLRAWSLAQKQSLFANVCQQTVRLSQCLQGKRGEYVELPQLKLPL